YPALTVSNMARPAPPVLARSSHHRATVSGHIIDPPPSHLLSILYVQARTELPPRYKPDHPGNTSFRHQAATQHRKPIVKSNPVLWRQALPEKMHQCHKYILRRPAAYIPGRTTR